jgi:hypothetical protein
LDPSITRRDQSRHQRDDRPDGEGYGVRQGHHEDDKVFTGGGLCIKSYAAAVTGLPVGEVQPDTLPIEWFGNVEHTHKAIDDAVGIANLLVELSRRVGT